MTDPLSAIASGLEMLAPRGSKVEWHVLADGSWRCVLTRKTLRRGVERVRVVGAAVDRTGHAAAARLLEQMWGRP